MLATLLAASFALAPQTPAADTTTAQLSLDAARREVTIRIGPFVIPNTGSGHQHNKMAAHETAVYRVTWPVQGWFHAFHVELVGADGQVLSRRFLHHVSMVNMSRRQLIYPAYERLLGASQEVDNYTAPKSIGVPMEPGMQLGTFIGWHNGTGKEIPGATLVIKMRYTPPNMMPRPLDVHLLYMDVAYTVGRTDAYTIPPGPSSRSYEFTLPVGGHLIAAGGHMHDYAKFVRLEDAESGKVLLNLPAKTDSTGMLKGVPTRLLGITGDGLHLKANHRYRVRADYDVPGADTLKKGAMALIVGAFVPDDPSRWPVLDESDPGIQRDIAMLESLGHPKPGNAMTMPMSMPMDPPDSGGTDHEHTNHE
jgi:hypothetical protein